MVFVSFTNHVAKSNNIAFLIHNEQRKKVSVKYLKSQSCALLPRLPEGFSEFIESPAQSTCRIALGKTETDMVTCIMEASVYIHSTVSVRVDYMSVFCQKSFRKRCVGNRNSFIDFMTRPSPLKPSTVVVACLNSAFLSVIKIQRLLQGFGKVEVIIILPVFSRCKSRRWCFCKYMLDVSN